jgi:hypothetical protein
MYVCDTSVNRGEHKAHLAENTKKIRIQNWNSTELQNSLSGRSLLSKSKEDMGSNPILVPLFGVSHIFWYLVYKQFDCSLLDLSICSISVKSLASSLVVSIHFI